MELKKNPEQPQAPQQNSQGAPYGAQGNSYYQNADGTPGASPYGNMGGASGTSPYGNMGGASGASPYGNMGGTPGASPYGNLAGVRDGSPYSGAVPRSKSGGGVNPLFIIIPVLVILAIIIGSQYKRIFGKAEYIPGTLSNNVYTNEYFGIKVTLSDDWSPSGYPGDAETEKNVLNSKNTVQELYGMNNNTLEGISIFVEQLPYNVKESGTDMDEIMNQLEQEMKSVMAEEGYNITSITQDSMTIAGKTYKGLVGTGRPTGSMIDVSLTQYYIFKGNYVCAITTASTSEGKAKLIITNNVSIYGGE